MCEMKKNNARLRVAVLMFFKRKGISFKTECFEKREWANEALALMEKHGLNYILKRFLFNGDAIMEVDWTNNKYLDVLIVFFLLKAERWFDEDIHEFLVEFYGERAVVSPVSRTNATELIVDSVLRGYSPFVIDVLPNVKGVTYEL